MGLLLHSSPGINWGLHEQEHYCCTVLVRTKRSVVTLLCVTLVHDIAKHLWVGIIREQFSQLCACLAVLYDHRAVGALLTYGIAVLQTWGWYSALRLLSLIHI